MAPSFSLPKMINTTSEYLITKQGVTKRVVQETVIESTDELLSQLVTGNPSVAMNVTNGIQNMGPLCVCAGPDWHLLHAKILMLPLKTWWIAEGNVLVPTFLSNKGTQLTHNWTPPSNMLLRFGVVYIRSSGGLIGTPSRAYLVAYDPSSGSAYRLPISNIYDDCKLCLNAEIPPREVMSQAFEYAKGLLENSPWGGDLFAESIHGRAGRFIRFSPDGQQQDPIEDWRKLSIPANTEVTKRMALTGAR